jgi:two-component system phosphate regulon sensor histidine kinase PhoR
MKIRSIRWRIAVTYILLIIATIGGLSLFLSDFLHNSYLQNFQNRLLTDARLVADESLPILKQAGGIAELDLLANHLAPMLDARVTIILPDGKVAGESGFNLDKMENHLERPEVKSAMAGKEDTEERYSSTLGADMLYAAVPIQDQGEVLGVARLSLPLEEIDRYITTVRNTIFSALLIAAALAVILAIVLASITLRPLGELTREVKQMSSSSAASFPAVKARDEVEDLHYAFRDLTRQINQQIEALQSERSTLAAVLAQMTDGIVIVDETGKIKLTNPAALKMFQVKDEEASERTLIEVLRHHQLVELWQKSRRSNEQQSITFESSPERLYIQAVAISLASSMPGCTLLMLQDLTNQRRVEMVRRDFISNVSHELRTPLASLKALVETLQEGALEDPPAAQRFLSRMDTEIDNLTQMVRELLELSRIESGRVPLVKRNVAPQKLIQPAAERMRLQAERAGLNLQVDCPSDLPLVLADPERLEQVLVNLIHNAIKFTLPGGTIKVSARVERDQVIFAVQDNGVGISTEDLGRIFERFYKSDRSRSGGGTGLGLSIARHMIEAHGGRIWAESQPGKGSTFFFTLRKL